MEQGHYGFPCRKPTWLYAFGTSLPPLRWGDAEAPLDAFDKLSVRRRRATPVEFRDVLLAMARSVQPGRLRGAA